MVRLINVFYCIVMYFLSFTIRWTYGGDNRVAMLDQNCEEKAENFMHFLNPCSPNSP